MIQLNRDYLLFQTSEGQIIPCSAELVAVELIGEVVGSLDPELIRQAAKAVLHYFKEDLGRSTVSVGEFSGALEQALTALGLQIRSEPDDEQLSSFDLSQLAGGAEKSFELSFFPRLREELHALVGRSPKLVQFHGLRLCVKQLVGAKRWNQRCQSLNDQIVAYLRACLETEETPDCCGLVIR